MNEKNELLFYLYLFYKARFFHISVSRAKLFTIFLQCFRYTMIVFNSYNFDGFCVFRHFSAVMIFCVSGESDNGFWRPPHFGRLHEGLEVLSLQLLDN